MPALLDLPENAVGSQAALDIGIVKGVDRGQALFQHIDDGNHAQGAIFIPKLHQAGIDSALQQKLTLLRAAVLVHASAWVTTLLVAGVERKMLF